MCLDCLNVSSNLQMRTEYCGKYTLDQLAPLSGSTDPNYGASCANNFIFLEML